MGWVNDTHGLAFKASELKLYFDGEHTWAMKLSEIARRKGRIFLVTYSLPNLKYVVDLLGKRPTNIWLIANSKFGDRAWAIKRRLPDVHVAVVPDVHTKVCVIEPKTIYITSANFGISKWHETTLGVRSATAASAYLEQSFWPLWNRSEVLGERILLPWPEAPDEFLPADRLQIETAAQGCVSGTLGEWPLLAEAMARRGYALPSNTTGAIVSEYCQRILDNRGA